MRIATLWLYIVATFFLIGQSHARSITLEDYLDWETADSPQISPDGKLVLYTRSSVDKAQDSIRNEIWAFEVDSDQQYRLLEDGSLIRWSPEGDRIAYLGNDGQIYVRRMDDAGAISRITTNVKRIQRLEWAPNGEFLIFRAEAPAISSWAIEMPKPPEGAKWNDDPVIVDKMHYRRDRFGRLTGYQHLFVIPADGGTPRQITNGEWNVGTQYSAIDYSNRFSVTPDSKAIVFAGVADSRELMNFKSSINRVDIATGDITQLSQNEGLWNTPRVSPDGKKVVYIGGVGDGVNRQSTNLRLVNIDGTNDRLLAEDLPAHISTIFWNSGSSGAYYSVNHAGRTDVFFASLNGEVRQITKGYHRFFMSSVSKSGLAAGVYTDPNTTENVALVHLRNGQFTHLTDLNNDILYDVSFGDVEEVIYPSTDGFEIQGWLVKPPNYSPEKRYPLILNIHGGPEGMYGVDFDLRFQDYAANGYIVLYVNPRGSSGYGKDFMHAINDAFPGQGDYEDLMAGVDHLIDRGIVDTNRMYVAGCSGGGALTAWVVTKTDRFAAAASLCPVINWISFGGQSDISYWGMTRFSEPYWENPALWLEHSPIMHVGKVSTPTLLMTGDKDLRTPIAQAEEFFSALKMRGVKTKLISMKGEYHGVWSIPSNFIRAQLYQKKWFEEHRKNEVSHSNDEN